VIDGKEEHNGISRLVSLKSTSDVLSYTKETHEIELTPDGYQRILGLDIPVYCA